MKEQRVNSDNGMSIQLNPIQPNRTQYTRTFHFDIHNENRLSVEMRLNPSTLHKM